MLVEQNVLHRAGAKDQRRDTGAIFAWRLLLFHSDCPLFTTHLRMPLLSDKIVGTRVSILGAKMYKVDRVVSITGPGVCLYYYS